MSEAGATVGAMQLREIRKTIAETWSDHWEQIDHGPLFRHTYTVEHRKGIAEVHYHEARWVLREDIDISLEYGMAGNVLDGDEIDAPWGQRVDYRLLDVFYRNALVDRVPIAAVDGFRALLPYPDADGEGTWVVTPWRADAARLVDDLLGKRAFDRYLEQSGIKVLPRR